MINIIIGIGTVAVGLSFLYGMLSRGKSLVKGKVLGIWVPIRWIQLVISLLLIGGGIYILLR